MLTTLALAVLGNAALIAAQVTQVQAPAPSPTLLTSTKSGVLPVLPTPFNGVLTLQGAIIDKGATNTTGFSGLNGPAVAQNNQPANTYRATLPARMFNPYAGGNITGTISGVGTASGVQFSVNFQGFPNVSAYGPFVYHIHNVPVPADGNCTSTLAHFDPTNRGEYWPCNANDTKTCQAGDLAGKHGRITGTTFSASYVEPYLSTNPASPYFFGNLSIVIHSSNTTRLTCANFAVVSSNGTTTSSVPTSTVRPTTVPTAAAGGFGVSNVLAGAAAGAAAVMFAL